MPTLRRAVFDTNVLISAYLWPGIPRTALEMIRNGSSMLVSAQPAIEEFVRVLGYRKFELSPEEIAPLVDDLTSLSTIVHPRHTVDVVTRDPTDNLFLRLRCKESVRCWCQGIATYWIFAAIVVFAS